MYSGTIAGTVTSVIIGMATGALAFSDSFAAIGESITGM